MIWLQNMYDSFQTWEMQNNEQPVPGQSNEEQKALKIQRAIPHGNIQTEAETLYMSTGWLS